MTQDILLIKNGRPCATVVIGPNASPTEVFAASELIRYVKAVGCGELSLSRDTARPNGTVVFVGQSHGLDALGVRVETDFNGPDPYRVWAAEDNVALVGQGDRGTLYAVYDFIESCLGVRFVAPGKSGDIIPKRKNIAVPPGDRLERPAFQYRIGWNFAREFFGGNFELEPMDFSFDYVDWAVKNRMQIMGRDPTGMLERGGAVNGTMAHSFDRLLPPEKFGKAHPEYFALVNGERLLEFSQPCTTNPEVIRLAVERLAEQLRNNMPLDFVSLSPNDNYNWCQCEKCTALDTGETFREAKRKGDYTEYPVVSDRMWTFVNAVVDGVSGEFPNQKFYIFAYQNYLRPPSRVKPHKNVYVAVCHMSPACYAHAIDYPDCSENHDFAGLVEAWAKAHDQLLLYAYTTKNMWNQNPWPIARSLGRNIEFIARQGFVGLYSQALPNMWGQLGQNFYVMARKLWNPAADVDTILADYFQAAFGSAGCAMQACYDRLESAFSAPDVFVHHLAHEETRQFLTPEVIGDCRRHIEDALRLASDNGDVMERIARVRAALEYGVFFMEITLELEAWRTTGKQARFDAAVEKHGQMVKLVREFAGRDTFDMEQAQHSAVAPYGRFKRGYYYDKWSELFEHLGIQREKVM